MKSVFIGHFSPADQAGGKASSAAGDQVQRQILTEMQGRPGDTLCYAMQPLPAWPKGPLLAKSLREEGIEFIGYVNVHVIKHIVFSLRMLSRLLAVRPRLCVQYNAYLFENLALLLFRVLGPQAFLVILIQDIHAEITSSVLSRRGMRALSERFSIFLSRAFDLVVPISRAIIADFGFVPEKCILFQGGVTAFAEKLIAAEPGPLEDIGVFAGALEPHNGVDRLVDQWLACGTAHTLHVFGRGSLQDHVATAAAGSARIVFHGLQPEHVILQWQLRAKWNFCLRYSAGLNQEYFFPSKMFNVVCAPGTVIVNDFYALPDALRPYLDIVADDLSDLGGVLNSAAQTWSAERVERRREIVSSHHSWNACVRQIISSADLAGREAA